MYSESLSSYSIPKVNLRRCALASCCISLSLHLALAGARRSRHTLSISFGSQTPFSDRVLWGIDVHLVHLRLLSPIHITAPQQPCNPENAWRSYSKTSLKRTSWTFKKSRCLTRSVLFVSTSIEEFQTGPKQISRCKPRVCVILLRANEVLWFVECEGKCLWSSGWSLTAKRLRFRALDVFRRLHRFAGICRGPFTAYSVTAETIINHTLFNCHMY